MKYKLYHFALLISAFIFAVTISYSETPSFSEVTGFEFGDRITQHHEMTAYLERIAEVSDRVVLVRQGYSWEGRELLLAIVTSSENHDRLDEIRSNVQRLGDSRTISPREVDALIEQQPVVVWLGGSIHGTELSGAEGLLKLFERLTIGNDAETLGILQNSVVLIDPILNPDGRDAHIHFNKSRTGREPSPERENWSNNTTSWEGVKFRTGHYFFDTNRDWIVHSQMETLARIPTLREWRPQAGVDAHEMGPNVEFFFDPPTDPVSPYIPDYTTKWLNVFGKAYATAFDEHGFEYTKREMFNYFFPGYTTTYLSYQGAAGMLFEQGTTRGLKLRRSDGSVRTFKDAVNQQYVAAVTMVRTAVNNRTEMLRDYYDAHREAIDDGKRGVRRYLITPEGDPRHLADFINIMIRNGVEVNELTDTSRLRGVSDRYGKPVGTHDFVRGTYIIEAAQPRNRLIRALLEREVPMPDEFLKEARERLERGENPGFYDITGYSLPLLFNLDLYASTDGRSLSLNRVTSEINSVAANPDRNAGYAYIIDGDQSYAITFLYHLRAQGFRAQMMTKPTLIEGKQFSRGSVVVLIRDNEESLHTAVRELAIRYDIIINAVDTGIPAVGYTPLGSPTSIDFKKPNIALIAEYPVQGYSFGWAWYTLDQLYEIPITVLRVQSLRTSVIGDYDVIVLPNLSGSALARELGEDGLERLKRWVSDGGNLVALGGGAVDFVREQLDLSKLRSWYDTEEGENAQRFSVPGAIFQTDFNEHVWMTSGYGNPIPVLITSNGVYLAPEGPPSSRRRVIASYSSDGDILISGHAWDESRERLSEAVYAYEERIGSGRVILFAEDPNFRAFTRSINRLFLNAVVVGHSAP